MCSLTCVSLIGLQLLLYRRKDLRLDNRWNRDRNPFLRRNLVQRIRTARLKGASTPRTKARSHLTQAPLAEGCHPHICRVLQHRPEGAAIPLRATRPRQFFGLRQASKHLADAEPITLSPIFLQSQFRSRNFPYSSL